MEILTTKSFSTAVSNGISIIDFFAPWCGPCRMIAPIFEKLSIEFDGKAKFYKVDIDQDSKIAADYGVISIPTIIVFSNGSEIDRKVGGMREIDLRIWMNEFCNRS